MTIVTNFLTTLLPILQTVLILAGLIGGAIAGVSIFKNAKNTGIVELQSETIVTMQAQIDALKEQNARQQIKIDEQDFKLQAVQDTLGIAIAMDGEHVAIRYINKPPDTTRHVIRRPTRKIPDKKTEEEK